jgi:hypothetical protein
MMPAVCGVYGPADDVEFCKRLNIASMKEQIGAEGRFVAFLERARHQAAVPLPEEAKHNFELQLESYNLSKPSRDCLGKFQKGQHIAVRVEWIFTPFPFGGMTSYDAGTT